MEGFKMLRYYPAIIVTITCLVFQTDLFAMKRGEPDEEQEQGVNQEREKGIHDLLSLCEQQNLIGDYGVTKCEDMLLLLAARFNHQDIFFYVLNTYPEEKIEELLIVDESHSALNEAIFYENLEIVNLILNSHYMSVFFNKKFLKKFSPLHCAIHNRKKLPIIESLLTSPYAALFISAGGYLYGPVKEARACNYPEAVDLILKHFPNIWGQ
jgi:hypothetical protein